MVVEMREWSPKQPRRLSPSPHRRSLSSSSTQDRVPRYGTRMTRLLDLIMTTSRRPAPRKGAEQILNLI